MKGNIVRRFVVDAPLGNRKFGEDRNGAIAHGRLEATGADDVADLRELPVVMGSMRVTVLAPVVAVALVDDHIELRPHELPLTLRTELSNR